MHRKYFSKVLLFGEYLVTLKGEALALPNKAYFGRWEYGLSDDNTLNEFGKLSQFIETLPIELQVRFDRNEWEEDLAHGLYFKSNIPMRYGLGSSGALVAAFYNRYFHNSDIVQTAELKSDLGAIESYFHGLSSGFDPLVSFLDQAVHINSQNEIQTFNAQLFQCLNQIKLIDTKIERNTSTLMAIFKRKLNDYSYFNNVLPEMKKANADAISALLNNDKTGLENSWRIISELQFSHFSEMIPDSIKKTWHIGLMENQFIFKLCGAGGGGYILCFFPGNKGQGMLALNGILAEEIKLFG